MNLWLKGLFTNRKETAGRRAAICNTRQSTDVALFLDKADHLFSNYGQPL